MSVDRKVHWEAVYRDKQPLEVSWYQREPTLSLQLIDEARPALDAPIIDVGGGASTLVDCLLSRGYSHLTVLDLSATALAHAKKRLKQAADAVEWWAADVTRFAPPHPYQLWHDRAVFHFLTSPEDRAGYVAAMTRALPVGGRAIIAAFAIGGPSQCSGLDIIQYDAEKLAAELGAGFRLLRSDSETHITPSGVEQAFDYHLFERVS